MNREQRRLLQKQGQVQEDGSPAPAKREPRAPKARPPKGERTSPAQFVREVRGELRRVAWPTRGEVVKYSSVVLCTLIVVTLLIFGIDFAFGKGVLFLFDV